MARPGRKKRTALFIVEIICLLLFIGGLYVYGQIDSRLNKIETPQLDESKIVTNVTAPQMSGYTTYALFGIDQRSKNAALDAQNSDTIIIASINNDTKEVKLASVYRDTLLDIGNDTYTKANSAYAYGGPEQAISMLNTMLDLKITDYVTVNFNAMVAAIDALGGQSYSIVDMSVEQTEEKNRLRMALEHIEDYSWLAFTSPNTITLFFKWLREWNIDVRKLAHLKLAVVGAGTRDALKAEGYIADYVPDEYTTSALARGLANVMNDGEKLLLPRAVQGSETMLDILDQGGVAYEEIPVYDVVGRRMESIQYLNDLDVITFVSASGVRGFLDVLDAEKKNCGVAHMLNDIDSCGDHTDSTDGSFKIHDIMKNIRIAALGNVTEKALEKVGYHADIVPEVGDIEHLISAIGDYYFREKRQ